MGCIKIKLLVMVKCVKLCFCWLACLVDLSVSINSSQNAEEIIAAGQNGNEYLQLAKKGGGHKGKR